MSENSNIKETGAALGIIEFVLENLAKIEKFMKAGDLQSAERYREGLTVILRAEVKRISVTKRIAT